jgi:hypothetical protein
MKVGLFAWTILSTLAPLSECAQPENAPDYVNQGRLYASVPIARRQALIDGIRRLLEFERAENWTAVAGMIPAHHFQGETKEQWISRMKSTRPFFGKKLVAHRVDAVADTGIGEIAVSGCAKLSGQRRGYQTVIFGYWEGRNWLLDGPHAVMQLDRPAERCDMSASDQKTGRIAKNEPLH